MQMEVEEEIKKAQHLLHISKETRIDRFSRIYPFSNENVKGMFDNFDLMDKVCFSVLASSD